MSWREKFKHAFAVDAPGPAEPTEEQRVPVDWLARQVTRFHMATPGLMTLELFRPMNWIFAQGMHLTEPAVWAISPQAFYDHYTNLAAFLEQRGSIDHLCRRIEQLEAESTQRERPAAPTNDQHNGPSDV